MSTSVNLDSEAWLEQYLSIDGCWINTAVPMHPSQHVWNAVRLWNSSFFLWFFPYLLCSSYTAFPSPISLIHSLPHVPSSSLHSHFSPFYLFFFLLLIPVLLALFSFLSTFLHHIFSHLFLFPLLPIALSSSAGVNSVVMIWQLLLAALYQNILHHSGFLSS